MYALIETVAVTPDDPADLIAATLVAPRMVVYGIITNPLGSGQTVSLVVGEATTGSGLRVPEGKRYLAGPFFGEDFTGHGLFAAATAAGVTVDVVRAAPFVDNSALGGSNAASRIKYELPPFQFHEVSGGVDDIITAISSLNVGGVNVAITLAAEVADAITATITCGDGQQHDLDFNVVDESGDPLEAAVVTVAIGAAGTLLSATAQASGRVRTNSSGVANLVLTDVAGASSQAFSLLANLVAGGSVAGAFNGV